MSKKYYSIEDAVNNVSKAFKLGLKDANKMSENELDNAEKHISKYVKFIIKSLLRGFTLIFVNCPSPKGNGLQRV